MHKRNVLLFGICFISIILIASYSQKLEASAEVSQNTIVDVSVKPVDISEVSLESSNKDEESAIAKDFTLNSPNEAGKVIIVMFHKFIETNELEDQNFTTSMPEFKKVLEDLYNMGFRLTNLKDYLNNSMDVPKGCMPIVFTFDDGSSGQFNLIYKNGKLTVNNNTAVGVMEEFYRLHPDFGLKGTFYVNLGLKTFDGKGSVADRLKYLLNNGFEIGNHTFTHNNLSAAEDFSTIEKEIGENQKQLQRIIRNQSFTSFAWPYGKNSDKFIDYVKEGTYKGVHYKNDTIMLIRDTPALSPISTEFNPNSLPRIRAAGFKSCNYDLLWWLQHIDINEMYVSDGDINTVTVPKSVYDQGKINQTGLKGKTLVINNMFGGV
jgi:peptidoglycan/xylan/chitin deacetylase (PgdA/CDA1 family)